ncbi:unnamed protein product, partial [Rotaria magnacalcarata]
KNRRVDRISILLQEFNIEKIIHIKGRHNCLADYLSRHPTPREEEIFDADYGIVNREKGNRPSKTKQLQLERNQNSTTTPTHRNTTTLPPIEEEIDHMPEDSSQIIANKSLDVEQLKIEQGKYSIVHQKIVEVMKDPVNSCYEFKNGLLYKLMIMREGCTTKKKLIYLPSSMINDLLQVYHGDPLSGHFGVQRTYLKIKHNRTKKPGRLQPIPPPEGPFQLIGMDYCGPFKQTPRGNQYVLCLTDYFTR